MKTAKGLHLLVCPAAKALPKTKESGSVLLRRLGVFRVVEGHRTVLRFVHDLRRGVLLPQVLVEWGWNRDDFLKAICQKAGLPEDAWKEGADLYIFSAQVFREPE